MLEEVMPLSVELCVHNVLENAEERAAAAANAANAEDIINIKAINL